MSLSKIPCEDLPDAKTYRSLLRMFQGQRNKPGFQRHPKLDLVAKVWKEAGCPNLEPPPPLPLQKTKTFEERWVELNQEAETLERKRIQLWTEQEKYRAVFPPPLPPPPPPPLHLHPAMKKMTIPVPPSPTHPDQPNLNYQRGIAERWARDIQQKQRDSAKRKAQLERESAAKITKFSSSFSK